MQRTVRAVLSWPYTFVVVVSLAIGIVAIYYSGELDKPLKDPDGFLGPAYIRLPLIGLLFFLAGVIPQAMKRTGIRPLSNLAGVPRASVQVVRDEWTWSRLAHIATGLIAFYVCYVSYRNIKSYLPFLRVDEADQPLRFDVDLLRMDHWLFFGNNPGPVLHDLLGTSFSAQILATAYVSYLALIPLTLGALLVWNRDVSLGAWYATALSLNWVLGTISYYALPTVGPAFWQPNMYSELPTSAASALQDSLFRNCAIAVEDPTSGKSCGIAGFASLHVSVVVTACLFFVRTGQVAVIRIAGWLFLLMTVLATIYFGWHYLADDIAGAAIGWLSVSLGAWATGNRGRRRRSPKKVIPADEPTDENPVLA